MFIPQLKISNERFVYASEALTSDEKFNATPQMNIDEGPSDAFKDRQQKAQAKVAQAKKDEASLKKQEAPDLWVRIVIYLAFKIDMGGEGTIEQAIASLNPEQKLAIDKYVEQLNQWAQEAEKKVPLPNQSKEDNK